MKREIEGNNGKFYLPWLGTISEAIKYFDIVFRRLYIPVAI